MAFSSKKITINALSAVLQVVFTALLYFFLYKYLLSSLGVEQLGVWSLILSFSSIANLANLGMTSGLVKFVAEYLTEDDKSKIGKLIFTSTVTMAIMFLVLSLIIFAGSGFLLKFIIDEKFLTTALIILPYSLASLSVNAIGGVFTSVLEGYQKNYIRNFIYIASGVVMLLATFLLTPLYHLEGVAMAQLLQSVFILIIALVFTIIISPNNKFSNWKWSGSSFKELFNYGYKFQLVSISQLLYEPVTKLLLTKFGGLALVGHYEMATKAVNQFRALLTNANQVVVPIIAEKAKTEKENYLQGFYTKMNRILLLFNLPLSTTLLVISPIISIVWLGSFNYDFVFSMLVLCISTFINIMCGPAYFSSLGEGRLNILVLVHVGMAVINIILGFSLGQAFGGYGIIVAWAIALSIGSILVIINYNKHLNINYLEIFKKNDFALLIISLIILGLNYLIFIFVKDQFLLNAILTLLSLLLYLPVIIKNESVRLVFSSIKKKKDV